MTYREYFCIFEVLLFTIFSVLLLLKYFCIEPVYKWLSPKTDLGIASLFVCLWFYCLSIGTIIIEVIFGGTTNADGVHSYELLTFFNVMPVIFIIFGIILRALYLFVKLLHNKHENIVQHRKGNAK